MPNSHDSRWLLLIHQIPPKPAYLRVKIGRRLQGIGAVAIKNTVYVLPATDQALEHFQWIAREIVEAGAEATVCEAKFIEGRTDAEIEAIFNDSRAPDYEDILEHARAVLGELPEGLLDPEIRRRGEQELARLERRLSETRSIDFFGAPGSEAATAVVAEVRRRVTASNAGRVSAAGAEKPSPEYHGRTWVTRRGVHIDRIASAWLIRRFIDPRAHFKYVPAKGYEPEPDEIRFDMFEAECTHERDCCTFEILLERFGLEDPALLALAELIHDVDLKDGKFQRPETEGVAALIAGICIAHRDDSERIERGAAVFEDLYSYYQKKPT